ncbi:DNA polymerase III subunit delta' [Eilatimonas milleporae]|uniref:DNA polymerase III delta prime subunit n=1 Tax=Eilatimonas milleporae TaxID=911205 RepID=A0A3M0CXQ4_9PROT|nr:DNA polymerase III subunit delta' [Eilatimonas milleporae]RMB08703.1 DNA polymerase III delta prime subunit [Eilatimonas milleporae]
MVDDGSHAVPDLTVPLIGHDEALPAFVTARSQGRLHHAWLITGPKGIGKAGLAWRLAAALQSGALPADSAGTDLFGEGAPTAGFVLDPGHPAVRLIAAGAHPGVLYLSRSVDAKTGRMKRDIGVDQVRRLGPFFGQTATDAPWRIVIVDAADELNPSSANALLKLLEEPPKRALLFLVSHVPGRLLPTIRSRCRTLAIRPIAGDRLTQWLIAESGHAVSADDAALLARLSAGAPGRALMLVREDGATLYRALTGLLSAGSGIDTLMILSAGLAAPKEETRYRLFLTLLTDFLGRFVRFLATGETDGLDADDVALFQTMRQRGGLDRWLELWEKTNHLAERADVVNLDRKQLLIGLLSDFTGLAA